MALHDIFYPDSDIILSDQNFTKLEQDEISKVKFASKPVETLTPEYSLTFNRCKLNLELYGINVLQKDQAHRLQTIKDDSPRYCASCYEQRARWAYIASICQPEAALDLSIAVQVKQPTENDIKTLNKRLNWLLNNKQRGLKYISLDLKNSKLIVFVDASFANNSDYSSQIGYVIVLGKEVLSDSEKIIIIGNIIH
ncbi:hypothetical protein EPUL_001671 [Erysiphe pulchra]|uniref:Uncharacterized protein n=1 Tax=Erysiphe pulchra TaxID=225359 RepID=A0A2S4PY04_9PEZI|nr:hypothetical protein EPUL_001671 [Erysiphe pulchra]